MAASQPNLPPDVLEALESCIKAAERFGYACATGSEAVATARGPKTAAQIFETVQETRRTVVRKMEEHANRMYESGIDMGRAQEGAL